MDEFLSKYYKMPFIDIDPYIYDSESHMCLMWIGNVDDASQKLLINILNGEKGVEFNSKNLLFSIKDGEIFYGERKIILVRGWGRLQYIKTDDPGLIQDTFGQWVVDKLNNYNK